MQRKSIIKYNGEELVPYRGGWYRVSAHSENTANLLEVGTDTVIYGDIPFNEIYGDEDTLYLWGYVETI